MEGLVADVSILKASTKPHGATPGSAEKLPPNTLVGLWEAPCEVLLDSTLVGDAAFIDFIRARHPCLLENGALRDLSAYRGRAGVREMQKLFPGEDGCTAQARQEHMDFLRRLVLEHAKRRRAQQQPSHAHSAEHTLAQEPLASTMSGAWPSVVALLHDSVLKGIYFMRRNHPSLLSSDSETVTVDSNAARGVAHLFPDIGCSSGIVHTKAQKLAALTAFHHKIARHARACKSSLAPSNIADDVLDTGTSGAVPLDLPSAAALTDPSSSAPVTPVGLVDGAVPHAPAAPGRDDATRALVFDELAGHQAQGAQQKTKKEQTSLATRNCKR